MDIQKATHTRGTPTGQGSRPAKKHKADEAGDPKESFHRTHGEEGGISQAAIKAHLNNAASGVSPADLSNLFNLKAGPAWTYRYPNHPSPKHGMAMGSDGGLYTGAYKTLVKLDPASGKEVWKKDFEGEPNSYPMVEAKDGSLLVMFGYDRLAALDPKTGDERWSYDTNKTGFWDPQPVVGPDGSIFTFRNDRLAVLDARGKEKWKCRVGKYSPSILGIDQTGQAVVKSGREIVAFSPKGKELWRAEGSEGYFYPKDRESVFITNNDKIEARDRETGEIKWERPYKDINLNSWPPMGSYGGKLLLTGGRHRTNLVCLDPASGKTLWENAAKDPKESRYVQVFDEHGLFTMQEENRFTALDLGSGKEKWSMELPPGTHAGTQAATAGGVLYVQVGTTIYGMEAATGKPISQNDGFTTIGTMIPGSDGCTLYVQDNDSLNVIALDTRSIDEKAKSLSTEISNDAEQAGPVPQVEVDEQYVMIDDVKIERKR
jgi:outer membrane protein assembly factor BamB